MDSRALRLALVISFSGLGAACTGSTVPPDDAADVATTTDAVDTTVTDSTPESCGTTTCGATEVCIHPCCGGAAPQCQMPDDAGTCPPGTSFGQCFGPSGPQTGCATQCTPPPPFCAPRPSSGCQGTTCTPCPSQSGVLTGNSIACQCA